jgi:hypothetical protein
LGEVPSIGRTEKGGTGVSLFSFHFFVTAGAYTDKEERKRWRQLLGHKECVKEKRNRNLFLLSLSF